MNHFCDRHSSPLCVWSLNSNSGLCDLGPSRIRAGIMWGGGRKGPGEDTELENGMLLILGSFSKASKAWQVP